jgi:hypothetical protein
MFIAGWHWFHPGVAAAVAATLDRDSLFLNVIAILLPPPVLQCSSGRHSDDHSITMTALSHHDRQAGNPSQPKRQLFSNHPCHGVLDGD